MEGMNNPVQNFEFKKICEFEEEVIKHSNELITMAVKIIPHGTMSARTIIDEYTVKRYKAINKSIFLPINKEYCQSQRFEILNDEDLESLMICWISLGSALEASLQIFLTAFKHNYDDNPALKWESVDFVILKENIEKNLDDLKASNIIDSKKCRSLKVEIRKILKIKENGLDVEHITLYDLLNYFCKSVWSECKYKEYLNQIRENRNIIHSFKNRNIDSWADFKIALKVYIDCLVDLKGTMSYLEDIVEDIESEYRSEMNCY